MNPQIDESRIGKSMEWYSRARGSYESLTKIICGTIDGLLRESNIDFLSVSGRAKEVHSFLEKIKRKEYTDPKTQVHDLAGIRIITYIESDVAKAVNLIKSAFNIHRDKSLDKTTELGVDRMGYRSFHLICDLGENRANLPEYAPYKCMLFEVQIRTVLQHAWAEIEHDRNYKFAGVLPAPIERRFHLASGTLEMVDHEFDALAKAIDEHSQMVAQETKKGNLNIPINSTSLAEFMRTKFQKDKWISLARTSDDVEIVPELKSFGLTTLADIDAILIAPVLENTKKFEGRTTAIGLIRNALMYSDINKYFDKAWNESWSFTNHGLVNVLSTKYKTSDIYSILKKHNIDIDDIDSDL